MTVRASVDERFWSKIDKNGPVVRPELGPCWIWKAALNAAGYGLFRAHGKIWLAHRFSHLLAARFDAGDAGVLHRCDVRSCVNPSHFFLGTNADNVADRHAKGRDARGDRNGARVHLATVVATRARGDRNGSRLHPQSRPRGEHHSSAKLTEQQVIEVRRLREQGADRRELAARLGVTPQLIRAIETRRIWRHL